jgi:hypothetical protein
VQRTLASLPVVVLALLAASGTARAQGLDVTVFLGRAYPIYDERLTLRASVPSPGGIDITAASPLELRTKGGLVLGAAVAFEVGILGIEGRLDTTDVAFDLQGTRFDLLAYPPQVPLFNGLAPSWFDSSTRPA